MIGNARVLGLVPARGGSKGLPGKNLRDLAGQPLLAWPIRALQQAGSVDTVIVSTDDAAIAGCAREHGAEVPFMRPAELASDTASSMDVVRHALTFMAGRGEVFEYVAMLEPTSPLTRGQDVDRALRMLDEARDRADAIVGVSQVQAVHPDYLVRIDANGLISPYRAPDFAALPRRQDVEELYFFEGSLYVSSVSGFLEHGSFYHARTLPYVVPAWKALEIDDYTDLLCVETVLRHRDALERSRPGEG